MPRPYRPNKSTSSPTAHIFLEVAPRSAYQITPHTTARAMRHWQASHCRMRGGQRVRRSQTAGETCQEFCRWLDSVASTHHSTWCWSHAAVSDWTTLGLWDAIDSGLIHLESAILNDPPNILHCSIRGKTVVFVDSLNWFRDSISHLGERVGVQCDPAPDESAGEDRWREWSGLNLDALEGTILQLIAWVKSSGLGMLRHTAPSQALASWRHGHRGPWPEPHDAPTISLLEREGYFGGRADLGFCGRVLSGPAPVSRRSRREGMTGHVIGDTETHVYDAQAFYPAMMRHNTYPYVYRYSLDSCSLDAIWRVMGKDGVISRVLIRSPSQCYPCRRNGQVYYACGEFVTTLAGPELAFALLNGDVARIGFSSVYSRADLFTRWVDWLYGQRCRFEQEGNKPWTMLVKLILNSLYGKFGQRQGGWIDTPEHPCRERWGQWLEAYPNRPGAVLYRGIAGHCQRYVDAAEHPQAVVSIPAYVTSYGRVLGREWREHLPARSLLYSDTDSLHVTRAGHHALERSGLLGREGIGALRLKSVVDDAEYRNIKLYRIGSEVIAGGCHQDDRLTGQFPSLAALTERFEMLLRRARDGTVRTSHLVFDLSPAYEHGHVGPDGFTIPFAAPCQRVPSYPDDPTPKD